MRPCSSSSRERAYERARVTRAEVVWYVFAGVLVALMLADVAMG